MSDSTRHHQGENRTITDLVGCGRRVDIHLNGYPLQADSIYKNVVITYLKRDWVGFSYVFRGIKHDILLPRESIRKIDFKVRVRPRSSTR